jgi:hypothetical protein
MNRAGGGKTMPGKRIKEIAPLTAAEKQKRYRDNKADAEKQSDNELLSKMRAVLIEDINNFSLEELQAVIKRIYARDRMPDLMTLKELSKLSGLSDYEVKKLAAEGVIQPEP